MDFTDTPSEAAFRDEARTWLAEHLVGDFKAFGGRGAPVDADGFELRREWERELGRDGWLGLGYPVEYGGRDEPISHQIIFTEECAKARAPYRASVQGTEMLGQCVLAFGTTEQKQRFLPSILSGDTLWCQGYSEPDAGSDLTNVSTRAVLDGDEWIINGHKTWTSMGHFCDWIYTVVRTNPTQQRNRGLSVLLIDMRQDGVQTRPIRNLAGGIEFDETFFVDARTSAGNVLGPLHDGFAVAMAALGFERGTAVLPYQIMFETETAALIDLARSRGLTDNAVVRQRLADAWIGVQVLRFNNYRKLTALRRGGLLGPESSFSKLYWATWHQRLSHLEMTIMGIASDIVGDGYSLDPMQRSLLISRAETIYGGTNEIHRNTIAERVLGLPKSPR
ncbi:MAG: acyl-CoA dehydrogenase family protein [Acidimicrobiia bacterium]